MFLCSLELLDHLAHDCSEVMRFSVQLTARPPDAIPITVAFGDRLIARCDIVKKKTGRCFS